MKQGILITTLLLICIMFDETLGQSCVGGNMITVTIQQCEGIQGTSSALLNIFPNPAADVVYISINNEMPYQLTVTDISGKMILKQDNVIKKVTVKTTEYSPGIYFLRLQNEVNEVLVTKFIIQNPR